MFLNLHLLPNDFQRKTDSARYIVRSSVHTLAHTLVSRKKTGKRQSTGGSGICEHNNEEASSRIAETSKQGYHSDGKRRHMTSSRSGLSALPPTATRLLKNHAGMKVEKQILKVEFCKVQKIRTSIGSPTRPRRAGILIKQRVEQNVRAHEHRRFPLFEQQLMTYMPV